MTDSSENPLVDVRDLRRVYESSSMPVAALDGVSLRIRRRERVALLGRSGSGKSTLLNLLAGLDRPTAGSIVVDGHDLTGFSSNSMAEYRLHCVGMIFQSYNLIPTRTALQNVELPLILSRLAPRSRRDQAAAALAAVGLEHRLEHRPAQLSGGEQQRVAVARALINSPRLLLADEPTGNLDSGTAAEVVGLLAEHAARHGATVVLVTHDEELAVRFADRVISLRDGAVDDHPPADEGATAP